MHDDAFAVRPSVDDYDDAMAALCVPQRRNFPLIQIVSSQSARNETVIRKGGCFSMYIINKAVERRTNEHEVYHNNNIFPLEAMTSTSTPPPAGKFYASDDENDDDDESLSSNSSLNSDSDDEDERQRSITQAAEEEDEEVIKIRQKAFDLINKAGGPSDEDRKQWPQSPKKLHYPVPQIQQRQQQQQQQQQAASQSTGERSFAGPYAEQYSSPYQQSAAGSQHPPAQEAEKLSITSLFINCVSDLCKQSGKEIVQSGASILSSGYQSVAHYKDMPLQGSYDPIDTSQHGYGNGNNNSNTMRGRYRD
jgi:hypothetical protein